MSEEAFSVTFVGLFGRSLEFLSMFCIAIVVAGGSWTSISGVRVRFHLLSTSLFQALDQVALEFTLTRLCWPPSAALSLAAICGARPPSAELGRHLRRSAAIGGAWSPSAALCCHRLSLTAICGAQHQRSSAAINGTRPPWAELDRHLRRSAANGGAWQPSCDTRPLSAALGSLRQRSAASGGPRPAQLGFDYWVPVPGFRIVGQP
jgi:hypothetical protein